MSAPPSNPGKLEPCPNCGERDCGGAPRFKGLCSDERAALRGREAALRTPSPSHLELIGLHLRGALEAIDSGDPVSAENDVQTALDVLTIAIDEERMGQEIPLTGGELAAKHGFKPHGRDPLTGNVLPPSDPRVEGVDHGRPGGDKSIRVSGTRSPDGVVTIDSVEEIEPRPADPLTCIHGKFHREPCDECEKLDREAFSMPVLEDPPEGHRTVVSYGKDGVKVSTEPTANPTYDDQAHGYCEDCGDLRWCCKASRVRAEREFRMADASLALAEARGDRWKQVATEMREERDRYKLAIDMMTGEVPTPHVKDEP